MHNVATFIDHICYIYTQLVANMAAHYRCVNCPYITNGVNLFYYPLCNGFLITFCEEWEVLLGLSAIEIGLIPRVQLCERHMDV